jgi:hypothetical protein
MPRVPLSLNGNQSFALAVHDDLLNQMLYALWAGGAFNLQVTAHGPTEVNGEGNGPEAAPSPPGLPTPGTTMLDAANVDVFFLSPPVVMPSDNDNEIVLGIGDVWARVERFSKETASRFPPEPLRAGFFCSTIIRAHIDIDAEHGHLVLTPLDPPELYLELNPVEPAAMTAAVHHWLSKNLKSMLLRRMSETLRSFPLPQLAIGRIPGVPQEAVWVPDTGTLDRPAHGAEVVVQGTLRDARAEAPEGFVP